MAALVARWLHSSNCIRNSTKSILLGAMIYIYWTFDVTGHCIHVAHTKGKSWCPFSLPPY